MSDEQTVVPERWQESGGFPIALCAQDEVLLRKTLLRCFDQKVLGIRVSTEHYRYIAEQVIALREHVKRVERVALLQRAMLTANGFHDLQAQLSAAEARNRELEGQIQRMEEVLKGVVCMRCGVEIMSGEQSDLEQQLKDSIEERDLLNSHLGEEHAELAAAKSRIGELEQEREWQPMKTAPLDGIPILVSFGRCGVHCVSWEESCSGTTGWCVDDRKHGPYVLRGYLESDIKGWMYLPGAAQVAAVTQERAELEGQVQRLKDALEKTREQAVLAGMEDTPLYGIPQAALATPEAK